MSTVKVFMSATTVEPKSNKDTKYRPIYTPRVLEYGKTYELEEDVARKLIDAQRADLVGEEGVPSDDEEAAEQITRADKRPSVEETSGKSEGDEEEVELPNEDSSPEEITKFAEEHKIDLTGARSKTAKLERINEAFEESEEE